MTDSALVVFKKSSVDQLADYAAFYRLCFPGASHLSVPYLQWLYSANPAGECIGADAYSGNMVVGQVIAVPGNYLLQGRPVKGLLAVNVAVHPKFQGRYLFKKLGLKMCEFGAEEGYEFVIGVANAAATPGWTRQMGFQLVRPLEARLGLGNLHIDFAAAQKMADFVRAWSGNDLRWRMRNPNNAVSMRNTTGCTQFFAQAKGKMLPAYAELPRPDDQVIQTNDSQLLSPFRLFLGLVPDGACNFSTYVDIPQRFRPSPLNLIYRSLTGTVKQLEKDAISFSFLDFDAY